MAVLDPMAPLSSPRPPGARHPGPFDTSGRSKHARRIEAYIALLRSDRKLAPARPSVWTTILRAALLLRDEISIPGAAGGLFDSTYDAIRLADLVIEVEGTLSLLISQQENLQPEWHSRMTSDLKGEKGNGEADWLSTALLGLRATMGARSDNLSARVFRDLLAQALRHAEAGPREASVWLQYGMTVISSAPSVSMAIILAVKHLLLDSKELEVAQNRLAGQLTGITSSQVPQSGIDTLRLLLASAPPAEAAATFLTQQRATFVFRHISSWITQGESSNIPDSLEYYFMCFCTEIAPIIQDLRGSHWDSMFDLVEAGLEVGDVIPEDDFQLTVKADLSDDAELPMLYQSLLLLRQIRDLSQTNKALRASWTAKDRHMGLVFDRLLQCGFGEMPGDRGRLTCTEATSLPMLRVQHLLLDLSTDIPQSTLEVASLPQVTLSLPMRHRI